MANLKSILVSVFLIFTVAFLFLAQSSEAQKGPKITNKVWHRIALKRPLRFASSLCEN